MQASGYVLSVQGLATRDLWLWIKKWLPSCWICAFTFTTYLPEVNEAFKNTAGGVLVALWLWPHLARSPSPKH